MANTPGFTSGSIPHGTKNGYFMPSDEYLIKPRSLEPQGMDSFLTMMPKRMRNPADTRPIADTSFELHQNGPSRKKTRVMGGNLLGKNNKGHPNCIIELTTNLQNTGTDTFRKRDEVWAAFFYPDERNHAIENNDFLPPHGTLEKGLHMLITRGNPLCRNPPITYRNNFGIAVPIDETQVWKVGTCTKGAEPGARLTVLLERPKPDLLSDLL